MLLGCKTTSILMSLDTVAGVMNGGNIAPRVGFEPTVPTIMGAIMLTIDLSRLPYVMILLTPTCLCGSLPEVSAYYYINTPGIVILLHSLHP